VFVTGAVEDTRFEKKYYPWSDLKDILPL
jgi:hypothetical protein